MAWPPFSARKNNVNYKTLQAAFDYDRAGGKQDLQGYFLCGDSPVIYYLFVRPSPFSLRLVRVGEVDLPGTDNTVDLGTHKSWKAVGDALRRDMASLGCVAAITGPTAI